MSKASSYPDVTEFMIKGSHSMQAVVASARTLQDITDERVVPVDYLGVLILLFMLLVLDRLFYSLGLHLGKVPFQPPRVSCISSDASRPVWVQAKEGPYGLSPSSRGLPS